MTNYDIAEYFSMLSRLMDLHGMDSFRSKTYSIAAYNIEKLVTELSQMDDAEMRNTKGIGEATGKKIREILDTGKLTQLEEIIAQTPPGVLEIMQVKGLGPKKVAVIWKEMGIESVGELEYACHENRLAAFKGFGQKTQEAVLQNIAFIRSNQGFHLWADMQRTGNDWIQKLSKSFPQYRFMLTGEIRRHMEILGSIEILSDMPPGTLIQYWKNAPGLKAEESEEGRELLLQLADLPAIKFYFVPRGEFGLRLFRQSCSESFLQAFESQYPLPQQAATEEELFTAHRLQYIPAPLREDPGILLPASRQELPQLVEAKDIKGIIHSHSRWSDGQETLETMAKHAISKGLEYLVISDHSQAAYYANGLTPERIAAQHQEIDALNARLKPFRIFKSIEADILNDGSLDYDLNVLQTFDLVIASVHSNLKMTEEKAMQRLLKAIENPYTTILGHMTGRLLLSREGYPVDHKAIIDACAANHVVIEINAHPRRLDLDWRWVAYALEKGVMLSVNPDAHALEGYDDVYYGCMAAQKGGLTADRNLSSFSLEQFEAFLQNNRAQKQLRYI
jgi:DNA polymerase (family X)